VTPNPPDIGGKGPGDVDFCVLRPPPVDANVVVLGAGLAGLSASYHLGGAAPIYEATQLCGGLAASREVQGFTFDFTGHLLHFRVPYCRALVASLLGEELRTHRRNAWIHLDGDRVKYPFQANLHDLPEAKRQECLDGFLATRGQQTRSRNFEEWVRNHFGEGIARHFMLPYNSKLWRYPLDQMSCAWIDSLIPQPNAAEVIEGARGGTDREFGYNIEFAYPQHGGIGRLAESFAPSVGPIHYGARARRVDPERRVVEFDDGTTVEYETLVSSIPLPVLLRLLDPCPPEIKTAASQLVWNSIININLGLDGRLDHDVHWIYFPEAEYVFYRAGFASNICPGSVPAGKSSMYIEVSFRGENPHARPELERRVVADLGRAGLLDDPSRIELTDYNVLPFAYVIYDLRYGETTRALHDYLLARGIHSIGRFGRWRYYSMEQTILDGQQCAADIRSAVAVR